MPQPRDGRRNQSECCAGSGNSGQRPDHGAGSDEDGNKRYGAKRRNSEERAGDGGRFGEVESSCR